MKDPRLNSTYHCDGEGLKLENNEKHNSIVNSVTNDEEDWINPKKNSERSIVRSVTNDEDEWSEPSNSGQYVPFSVQHHPQNYQSEFSKQETTINRLKHTRESTTLSKFPVSMLGRKPFENTYFEKESFLFRYERMMMEQEKEQLSTISHLHFFLELLTDLQLDGQDEVYRRQEFDKNKDNCLLIRFSIADLKQAQKKLKNSEKYDIVKTDKQFLMVLDILCNDKSSFADIYTAEKNERNISWAEIIQCYRNCVTGMQTLEKIGAHSTIRNRVKERTLALLSGYRISSFTNFSPSIITLSGTKNLVNSRNKTRDMSIVNPYIVDQEIPEEIKSSGLLNRPLVSFLAGMIVGATLLYGYPSNTRSATQFNDFLFGRSTEDLKTPTGDHNPSISMGREFKVFNSSEKSIDKSMTASTDFIRIRQTEGDSSLFKIKSLVTTKGLVVPSTVETTTDDSTSHFSSNSSNMVVFYPKLNTTKDYDDSVSAKTVSSLNMKVANVLGGTATIIYFLTSSAAFKTLLGWISSGLGVAIAALTAHGSIRGWISNIWKVNPNRKKPNLASH